MTARPEDSPLPLTAEHIVTVCARHLSKRDMRRVVFACQTRTDQVMAASAHGAPARLSEEEAAHWFLGVCIRAARVGQS